MRLLVSIIFSENYMFKSFVHFFFLSGLHFFLQESETWNTDSET